MKKLLFTLLFIVVIVNISYADDLGCFANGDTIYATAQFNNSSGEYAATSVTARVYDPDDAGTPSFTPTMTAVDGTNAVGLFRGSFTLSSPLTGGWTIRYRGSLDGGTNFVTATDTFVVKTTCPLTDKTGYALTSGEHTNIATDVWGATTRTVSAATNITSTGDTYARLGAPSGASVSADIAAVKSDTGAIKTKTDYLPSATAGAAGGVFIAGTDAATTVNITGNLSGSVGSVTGSVGSISANGITASSIATDAITDTKVADTLEQRLGWVADVSFSGNSGTFILTASGETISVDNQYVGMMLRCGNDIREIVATKTVAGPLDTITIEPGHPFASAPTGTCSIRWK
jgi:hypothetical protein